MQQARFVVSFAYVVVAAGCGEHGWRELSDHLSNGHGGKPPPSEADAGVLCPAIAYETNGRCEAPPGCEHNDAEDCKDQSACTLILHPTNGICEAAPGCPAQDPTDCAEQDDAGAAEDGAVGRLCGGYAGIQCAVSEFCDYPPESNCGFGDQAGTCKPLPSCTVNVDPVCGCDERTYDDECQAHAAGVSVKHHGACLPEGDGGVAQLCGGYAGLRCPAEQFCDFPVATACGSGDQAGTCANRPDVCTQEYAPVCGCDGQTYANGCTAAQAGTSIAHDRPC